VLQNTSGGDLTITEAETVSAVPLDLGASGSPLEGYYEAEYPANVLFAPASQFAGLQGDAVVSSESIYGNSPFWDLHYNGDSLNSVTVTQIGTLPNQAEDGIFVTAQILGDVPEPASIALFASALGLLGLARRRGVQRTRGSTR
jgi:hypothetical protein